MADERLLPKRQGYDQREPVWLAFGNMLGAGIGFVIVLVAQTTRA